MSANATPPWAIFIGLIVPTVLAVLFIGGLIRKVNEDGSQLERMEAHLEAQDAEIREIDRKLAVLAVRLPNSP